MGMTEPKAAAAAGLGSAAHRRRPAVASADGPRADRRDRQGRRAAHRADRPRPRRAATSSSAGVRDAGLAVRVDRVGNIFARRAGSDPARRRAVAAGSHIDTQPSGGKFDGNFGVLAALEVMRTLNDRGIETAAPLEVAIWTNEEGTRFTPVMMGSGAWAGIYGVDYIHAQRDSRRHVTVGAELARIGYAGDAPMGGTAAGPGFDAYFEAHIEQGPILEDERPADRRRHRRARAELVRRLVDGMDAHAGPTPMAMRRDAALGAARLVEAVNRIALAEAPDGRGTVGMLAVRPNSRNVDAGLRAAVGGLPASRRRRARADGRGAARGGGGRRASADGSASRSSRWSRSPPCVFDARLRRPRARRGAQAWACRTWTSSAAPATTPCTSRRSRRGDDLRAVQGRHQPQRDRGRAARAHQAGANVLLHAMLARAL